MRQSLYSMVLNDALEATPLHKFRRALRKEDQQALDLLLGDLEEYRVSGLLASHLSPFETILLLMTIQQQRRVECLETLLQRITARAVGL